MKFMAPDYSHTAFVINTHITYLINRNYYIIVVLHNGSDMHCFNAEY